MKTRQDMQAWLRAGMPVDEEQETAPEIAEVAASETRNDAIAKALEEALEKREAVTDPPKHFSCRCVVSGIFEPFVIASKFHVEMQELDSLLKPKARR